MTTTSTQTTLTLDSTANSNTGTKAAVQGPFSSSTGTIDGAQGFDGNNDYVGISSQASTNNLGPCTLSAWIYAKSYGEGAGYVASKEFSFSNGWRIRLNSGYQAFQFFVDYDGVTDLDAVSAENSLTASDFNKWIHFLITWDGTNLASGVSFYKNGQLLAHYAATETNGADNRISDAANNLYIGNDNLQDRTFEGSIDEVRVSNVARSASWIKMEYNNESAPVEFVSHGLEENLNCAASGGGVSTSDRSDTLSDSRPSEPSNHTLQFTVNRAIEATTTLTLTRPAGFSFTDPVPWYNSAWGYRSKITIDPAKIGGIQNLTDFPILVSSTIPVWKTTENGGHVGSATGWDFVFTKSDGVTKLDHEIEKFATTTGELVAWVCIPTLWTSQVNELYIYYGNPSASNQQNKKGVWDSNFTGVWHMTTTSTNTTLTLDSTANSNTGTKVSVNEPYSTSTGTIDGAQGFDGNNDYILTNDSDSLDTQTNVSISAWVRLNATDSNVHTIVNKNAYGIQDNVGHLTFFYYGTGWNLLDSNSYPFTDTNWHHVAATHTYGNGSATKIYFDGQAVPGTWSNNPDQPASNWDEALLIGCTNSPNFENFSGSIDEVRISNVARSASWIQTEYNNESSPSTFYTLGIEENTAGFDCEDVDIATGTQFALGGRSDCWATATHWGVVFATSSRLLTITTPSSTGLFTYVATGTQITVKIGTNATNQAQGNSKIINPDSAGSYRISLGGTAGSSGDFLVAIIEGQTVQVTIPEELVFTVTGVKAVNCTASDGATVTARDTSSTTITFGLIYGDTFYIGCQDLTAHTNGAGGYSLTARETQPLKLLNYTMPDTTCNGGTCTATTAGTWTQATKYGFGHTCKSSNDCISAYGNGAYFKQFADMSINEDPQVIMASTTPGTATGRIEYRLSANPTQAAGTYSNTIVYVLSATY